MFKHDAAEHSQAGVDAEQLKWKVQREIHQGKPRVIRQRKHQRVMQIRGQQGNLAPQHTTVEELSTPKHSLATLADSNRRENSLLIIKLISQHTLQSGWLGSRVVSVLDSGVEGPGFKSQSRHCRVPVSGKLFTPIVQLFTKQQNW